MRMVQYGNEGAMNSDAMNQWVVCAASHPLPTSADTCVATLSYCQPDVQRM